MDNLDRLNAKLRARERIFGYSVYMPDTYVLAEYMPAGVDYILFDCEHGPADIDYYSPFYRECRRLGIPTITRVPDATYVHVSHALDVGSDGIMLPRVETLAQVKTAVEGIHLPPYGKKGYGGKNQFYPGESVDEYRRRRIIWLQMESPVGAALLPEILEQYGEYISACVIGPYDLSFNAGTPKNIWSPEVSAVVDDVFAKCEKAGISAGIYVNDDEAARRRIAQGANLIWESCDACYMIQGIEASAKAVAEM